MDLSGRVVSLRLTADAEGVLSQTLPNGKPLQAMVMDSDAAGVWILLGEPSGEGPSVNFPVLLVKWNYIAELSLDYKLPGPSPRRFSIGFRPLPRESAA